MGATNYTARKYANQPQITSSEKRIETALDRLESQFGRQTRFSSKPPLNQLISTILFQRTNYESERKAFKQMWERFGSWEGIMNAPVEALTEAIASSNYPKVKAPRIKTILRKIYDERWNFDLGFLADVAVEEAMDWWMQFEGVGHKTTTFLLLFTFRKPVLPVDTHVHWVLQQLGVLDQKTNQAKAHSMLFNMLPKDADELLNYHKLFFKHGQRVYIWSYPR